MLLKRLQLDVSDVRDARNGLKFEIASSRVDGTELLKIEFMTSDDADEKQIKKGISAITRCLKDMKNTGVIQLFLTREGIINGGTESFYLFNKYPDCISSDEIKSGYDFVIIKL